jgi:hypothetical protein
MEDEIVALRESLAEQGLDAGAHTIQYHLQLRHRLRKAVVPSASSIWRVLKRRGFIVPQPHKRPKCSCVPSCPTSAGRPTPPTGRSPTAPTSRSSTSSTTTPGCWSPGGCSLTTKAADVVATFEAAATEVGLPASLLTDNGAIFTADSRGGRCAIETLLLALGATYKHGRAYHPRPITEPGCGDVKEIAHRW